MLGKGVLLSSDLEIFLNSGNELYCMKDLNKIKRIQELLERQKGGCFILQNYVMVLYQESLNIGHIEHDSPY